MSEVNIDATNTILGRLASYVAKSALLGNTVNVFNCENAVISGDKNYITQKYHHRIKETGQYQYGPFIPRMSDRFVRRLIRGMLPHKRARGREAFSRVMCYIGVPEEFKGKKLEKVKEADASKIKNMKYIQVSELIKALGGKA